ncbi:EamA family transporter [Viridibacillus sp. FSL H7-0596]|uniref:DMT family transporter n=1 Tax=Viridibacillus sp. FSL H7-0596 TaxID=1928923 RepID=UPI00096E006C|nr:DMT family transporter [Viridibacillus sp. FSL H7-0596]OMC85923.1 EamA family transporter [Viridibacillus sp. FSL H7-0596]
MKEMRKAYIAAIIYALIIGLSFMFVKIALTVASPLETLAHRFTVAWIVATIFLLLSKNKLQIGWKDLQRILPLALLYPILFFAFQVFGLARTSSSEAGIIQATIPIFTLLLASIILKENTSFKQLICVSLSVLGVIFIFMMNGVGTAKASFIGSGFILLSAITSALYNVFARKLTQQYSLFTLTYIMTLFGFIGFNGIAISMNVVNGTTKQFFQPFMHLDFVLAIVYLGILSSLITSFLSNYALSKMAASKMSVFSNVATLITILAGVLFLQEEFHYYHLVGALVIIIGVIGTNYFGRVVKKV